MIDLKKLSSLSPKSDWIKLNTIEAHTGGEPLRVILSGYPTLKGRTILEKREEINNKFDHLRTSLMWEPRGHIDMYGALLVEARKKLHLISELSLCIIADIQPAAVMRL